MYYNSWFIVISRKILLNCCHLLFFGKKIHRTCINELSLWQLKQARKWFPFLVCYEIKEFSLNGSLGLSSFQHRFYKERLTSKQRQSHCQRFCWLIAPWLDFKLRPTTLCDRIWHFALQAQQSGKKACLVNFVITFVLTLYLFLFPS